MEIDVLEHLVVEVTAELESLANGRGYLLDLVGTDLASEIFPFVVQRAHPLFEVRKESNLSIAWFTTNYK